MRYLAFVTFLFSAVVAGPYRLIAQHADSARSLAGSYPLERVYLHTDRDRYLAGDTLWFKAYLQADGLPSDLS